MPGYLLAVLSGLLYTFSFPRFGHPAVAWFALAPLLVAVQRAAAAGRPGGAWLLGLVAGLVGFAGTIYWVGTVMRVYGGLAPLVSIGVAALLVAYLALFPALFAWIVAIVSRAAAPAGLWLAPLAWVATEWLRTHLFTGFPWVLLGYSQVTVLPIAQLASMTGVYGVSALVAMVSAALAGLATLRSPVRYRLLSVAGLTVVVVAGWGALRIANERLTQAGVPLRVGIVQGNVAQEEKWDPARRASIFRDYLALTRSVAEQGASLIVWPEASTPFFYEEDPVGGEAVRTMARETGAYLLIGSDEIERGEDPRYFNAAFMVAPDGETTGVYRKVHLVPFGEYVPLQSLLFFAEPLVEAVSDFSAGEEITLLPIRLPQAAGTDGGRSTLVSTAICYEVIFPALVGESVDRGSELLTTITNDAWFGRSSAPYQHFEQAVMRAIEQGRYLVRSANTGISGFVDPYGRVLARTPIFERAAMVETVRILSGRTVYGTIGDAFAWAAVAMTLAALVAARRVPAVRRS